MHILTHGKYVLLFSSLVFVVIYCNMLRPQTHPQIVSSAMHSLLMFWAGVNSLNNNTKKKRQNTIAICNSFALPIHLLFSHCSIPRYHWNTEYSWLQINITITDLPNAFVYMQLSVHNCTAFDRKLR